MRQKLQFLIEHASETKWFQDMVAAEKKDREMRTKAANAAIPDNPYVAEIEKLRKELEEAKAQIPPPPEDP